MNNPKLARRYAQAFFDFAEETQNVEKVFQDILFIQEVYAKNNELKVVIESPIIFFEKKVRIFKGVFENNISEITYKFLRLIIEKRREPQLPHIIEHFKHIYYEKNEIKEVFLTTAYPVSEQLMNEIRSILEEQSHYKFIIKPQIDNTIIGGIIIKIDDYLFNASIQSKINKLKLEFSQNKYKAAF